MTEPRNRKYSWGTRMTGAQKPPPQTLDGSFSAVWTATIARVGAFSAFFEIYKIRSEVQEKGKKEKECKSCRSKKILQNEPLVAIVAVHTAENEPLKV